MNTTVAQRMDGFSPFYVMQLLQRAKQLELQGRDIIHMEIGEPDFLTPKRVVDAGIKHIASAEVKYTAAAGMMPLREKIAQHYERTYHVKIAAERIFVTPGASGAFLLAFGVSLNANDGLLMADPCYPCNNNFARFFAAKTQFINVDARTNYQLSADLIQQNWQSNSRGVLLASPSNPTGTLIDAVAFADVIKQVKQLQGVFYSDEIYHGLVYDQKATSALELTDDAFVINSFSKYFSMTGWRIGWLVVPTSFIDPVERLAQNIFISTATHSQYAALAAFDEENLVELEQRKQQFALRRDFLYQQLCRLGFKIPVKPQGAFYIYADCSAFTDDSFQFAKDLLEQQGLAVTPGKDFGNNAANTHIRFAYTASIAKMSVAVERLEHFIQSIA